MPAARSKPLVEVTGTKRPTRALEAAPPKLKELVAANGEGLLCGEVWLFGAGPRQAQREQLLRERLPEMRDTAAWLPLRRANGSTWTLVGECPGGQGFLVWDGLERSLRFFAAGGTWPEVGADLPELLAFLGRAGVLDGLIPVLGRWAEELTRRQVPSTYAVADALPGEAFAAALAAGLDAQPAFSALMDALPWPDGLWVAGEVLRTQPSADWAEQLDRVVGRSAFCQAMREALSRPPVDDLAALRALGCAGEGTVADETLAATRTLLPSEASMRRAGYLGQQLARRAWPPVLKARLRALSALEVVAQARNAQTFPSLWPLELLLGDARVLLPLADADYVTCLDAWLASPLDLAQAIDLARVRVKSAPVTEAAREAWGARARESLRTRWDEAQGTWALLLTQIRQPGVLELFQDLVRGQKQRETGAASLAAWAAEELGKSPGALELLRLVYTRPRVYDRFDRFPAATLAAGWGDEQAQAAVRAMSAAADRKAHLM